ncbi:hypothetical protein HKL94_00860 [Candidatus Parcubacteria bacterium]|nr:hypothetical protein [Candidatus Parcubacteria bacterium]
MFLHVLRRHGRYEMNKRFEEAQPPLCALFRFSIVQAHAIDAFANVVILTYCFGWEHGPVVARGRKGNGSHSEPIPYHVDSTLTQSPRLRLAAK